MSQHNLRRLYQSWLAKRFRMQDEPVLAQQDILIFIYQQGYLYLVLILITFIAGVNYANNLILGFCFFISAVLCISFYLTFKQLHGLKLEIIYPSVGRAGEPLELKILVQQDSDAPRYLYLKTEQQLQKVLLAHRLHTIPLHFFPQQRGSYQFPPIHLYSVYPFGLVRAWTYLYLQPLIWIAPQAKNFPAQYQSSSHLDQQELDEFYELRNFKTGDSYQSVSWKQVARGQGMFVKVFTAQEQEQSVLIDYAHMPSTDHEEKLSLMMGLIDHCEQNQQHYRIRLPGQEIGEGQGLLHYQHVQIALAQA